MYTTLAKPSLSVSATWPQHLNPPRDIQNNRFKYLYIFKQAFQYIKQTINSRMTTPANQCPAGVPRIRLGAASAQ
jgi:hypothetical protein